MLSVIKYKTIEQCCGLSFKDTALLVIDMQNYFYLESSHAQIPAILAIIPQINMLINAFPDDKIIYTKHYNIKNANDNMNRFWGRVLEKDTEYFELISDIKFNSQATTIEKQTYNAFHNTDLDSLLKNKNIKHLVICGVFAHLCVETSCREAFVRDYDVILPIDAIADYNYEYHKATVRNLAHGFAYISYAEEIAALVEKCK